MRESPTFRAAQGNQARHFEFPLPPRLMKAFSDIRSGPFSGARVKLIELRGKQTSAACESRVVCLPKSRYCCAVDLKRKLAPEEQIESSKQR
jgi:hypothetical protein